MKSCLFILFLLFGMNIALEANIRDNDSIRLHNNRTSPQDNPSKAKSKEKECITGGEGSSACRYAPGDKSKRKRADIGAEDEWGTSDFSCSVSCMDGYYACCGPKGCHCKM